MRRFVEGIDRGQTTLFPECLEDWIDEDNPVRVIDVFVDGLDLADLGFVGVDPETTCRPSYHPTELRSAKFAHSSSPFVESWACARKRALRSTAASSRRSIIAIRISRAQRWSADLRRSM